jgi:Na+/phosphate symporter
MMDNEVREKITQTCQELSRMLRVAFQQFSHSTDQKIQEAEGMRSEIRRSTAGLTNFIVAKSSSGEKGKEWAKPYLSMASSFDRMTYNIEGIIDQVKRKGSENILFSDRGVKEVNDVFQEAMDLLQSLPELIHSGNKQLAQHMGERVRAVIKIASGFSEEHEERLIQGICLPKSSPIYLGILESLKGIITHILEVSGKIVTLSSSKSSPSPPPSPLETVS